MNQIKHVLRSFIDKSPKISMSYRYLRDSLGIYEKPVLTPHGFQFIGHKGMQTGNFEQEETELVKRLLKHVDIVINVGANIGYYCCLAAQENKQVIAFEPIYTNLIYLLKNIKINHYDDKVEIYPIALSDKTGIIDIYGGGTAASLLKGWGDTPEEYVALTPCSTLDHILQSRYSGKSVFILVDVEGAEFFMLKGAISTLCQDPKPIWMIEINITEHFPTGVSINPNLRAIFQLFWENGYDSYTANTEPRLINLDEIENIEKSGIDSLKTHNFLFIEKDKNLINNTYI